MHHLLMIFVTIRLVNVVGVHDDGQVDTQDGGSVLGLASIGMNSIDVQRQ
jgi:hypothetical protein